MKKYKYPVGTLIQSRTKKYLILGITDSSLDIVAAYLKEFNSFTLLKKGMFSFLEDLDFVLYPYKKGYNQEALDKRKLVRLTLEEVQALSVVGEIDKREFNLWVLKNKMICDLDYEILDIDYIKYIKEIYHKNRLVKLQEEVNKNKYSPKELQDTTYLHLTNKVIVAHTSDNTYNIFYFKLHNSWYSKLNSTPNVETLLIQRVKDLSKVDLKKANSLACDFIASDYDKIYLLGEYNEETV